MGEPTQLTRNVHLRAGSKPGEHEFTLATEGEASDGHILSMAGGHIADRMPMFDGHFNSATDTMGSVINPRKRLEADPPALDVTFQIELSGEGIKAEIRRDLDMMITKNHVTAASIRWEGISSTPRTNLPTDHPFHVDREATPDSDPRKFGVFFHEWRAMEGSIVGIGADPAALMKMAEGKTGEQREYWRGMARDAIGDGAVDNEAELKKSVASMLGLDPDGITMGSEAARELLDTEPTLRDVIDEIRGTYGRINERLDELEAEAHLNLISQRTDTSPEPVQEPERADQPSTEEAEPRPPERKQLMLEDALPLLRTNRRETSADMQRLFDEAQGRVPDGTRKRTSTGSGSG